MWPKLRGYVELEEALAVDRTPFLMTGMAVRWCLTLSFLAYFRRDAGVPDRTGPGLPGP